jgi:hypothetical protein
VNGGVNGQESLGRSRRFESLHLAFASPRRLMRILSPIVPAQALLVASRQPHLPHGGAVGAQFVGHQHAGREALFLEQLAHQLERCRHVAPPLHQEIENFAFIVDCAPEPEFPSRNRDDHFVEMPPRRWPRTPPAKFSGEQRPELQDPSPPGFIGAK